MRLLKFVILLPIVLFSVILLIMFLTPTKTIDKNVYNIADLYSNSNPDMQKVLLKILEEGATSKTSQGIQGVASHSTSEDIKAIENDSDLQKIANAFNQKVIDSGGGNGPCAGLGQYIVAKAKEKGVSPFIACSIPGAESSFGKNCVKENNFVGMSSLDGSGGYQAFDDPKKCVDAMVNSVASYTKNGTDINSIKSLAKIYCPTDDPRDTLNLNSGWPSTMWSFCNEFSKKSGVSLDVKLE